MLRVLFVYCSGLVMRSRLEKSVAVFMIHGAFAVVGRLGEKEVAQDADLSGTFTLGRWRGPLNADTTGKSIHQSANGY